MKFPLWTILAMVLILTLTGCGCNRGLAPGDPAHYAVGDVQFTVRYAPGATFPTGIEDDGVATVEHSFWIGETEVTYELWYAVRAWAEENGYKFANKGQEGSQGKKGEEPSENRTQPVTMITWYDSAAWCNALSEYLEFEPVYMIRGEVYRDSSIEEENLVVRKVKGFRLPTTDEWELAARYRGKDRSHGAIRYPEDSKMYWTPGNYASGAKGPYTDEEATKAAAWYKENSATDGDKPTSQPVGQKPVKGNGLNLYDMCGNVFEWLYFSPGTEPAVRGSSYTHEAEFLLVGDANPRGAPDPGHDYYNIGFRLVLSLEIGPDEPDDTGDNNEVLYPVTSLVEVEWDGSWYDARVLEVDEGQYYIAYDGYDSSWNEWVNNSRIRERGTEPVVASVKTARVSVDYGTPAEGLDLPRDVEVVLKDGSSITAEVEWDISAYDGEEAGEYEFSGELLHLPVNLSNPNNVSAALVVRVRDIGGAAAQLYTGGETDVEGLLFYIGNDDGRTGYYYGNDLTDLTHFVLEENGEFAAMVVFNEDMYPIQWMLPDLTISVIVPKDEFFDPSEAALVFLLDDGEVVAPLNVEMNSSAGEVLEKMLSAYGSEFSDAKAVFEGRLTEMGWLNLTVAEAAELVDNPHEVALVASLSMAEVGLNLLEQVEALAEEDGSAINYSEPPFKLLRISPSWGDLFNALLNIKGGNPGSLWNMITYGYRINSGYYDGKDIEGPAVSMLLCKGTSSIPGVCHEFYIPNTPGNVSKCTSLCYASMSCFTDICHPQMFSVQDALNLRRPSKPKPSQP